MGNWIERVAPLHARRGIAQLDRHRRMRHFMNRQSNQNNDRHRDQPERIAHPPQGTTPGHQRIQNQNSYDPNCDLLRAG